MAGFIDEYTRNQITKIESQVPIEFSKGNFSGVAAIFDDVIGLVSDSSTTGVFSAYDYREDSGQPSFYGDYIDDPNVRTAFALDPSVDFADCADQIYTNFYADIGQSYAPNITYLLNNDVPVLLYNGQDDIIINTPGARKWVRHLDWEHIDEFENTGTVDLTDSEGNVLGTIKSSNGLSFSVVYKAGHTVPSYQPKTAQILLDSFIKNELSKTKKILE